MTPDDVTYRRILDSRPPKRTRWSGWRRGMIHLAISVLHDHIGCILIIWRCVLQTNYLALCTAD